ncbi:MAG: hypothetical protein JOZ33_14690 [Acidobacteriaceae bacterium]|nr:hypothetical protein [Acidobacteriaceae bacterium]
MLDAELYNGVRLKCSLIVQELRSSRSPDRRQNCDSRDLDNKAESIMFRPHTEAANRNPNSEGSIRVAESKLKVECSKGRRRSLRSSSSGTSKSLFAAALSVICLPMVAQAQNPELETKAATIKQAMDANQKKLAQYTWQWAARV